MPEIGGRKSEVGNCIKQDQGPEIGTDGSRKSAVGDRELMEVPGVTTATTGYTGQAEIGKGLTEIGSQRSEISNC